MTNYSCTSGTQGRAQFGEGVKSILLIMVVLTTSKEDKSGNLKLHTLSIEAKQENISTHNIN